MSDLTVIISATDQAKLIELLTKGMTEGAITALVLVPDDARVKLVKAR